MREATFRHGIEYPDNDGISLSDIAATLLAHERILPVVAEILEQAVPGLQIEKASIKLDVLKHGSLTEAFFVALLIVFQDDLEQEVPALFEAVTGYPVDPRYDTIVTVLFMVALYAATRLLLGRVKKGGSTELEAALALYKNIAAEKLNVSPERLDRIAERAVEKRKPTLIRAAIDIFRPAKRQGNGQIVPLNLPPIPAAAVECFPDAVALAEMDSGTVSIPIHDGVLDIRAMDRDRADRGWHGKLRYEDAQTKRLPIRLAPGVEPESLGSRTEAGVEAIIEAEPQKDGRIKPVRIHILRIND